MRARIDRTLDAEMEAARAAARRRRSIRDRLLDAEDRSATVSISTLDGSIRRGVVEAVGSDHVELLHAGTWFAIAIQHISIVEERS